jgi:hypothetical protein
MIVASDRVLLRRFLSVLLTEWLLLGPCCAVALADGGTIRLSRQQGGYRITVFTSPTPFRAGPVDISVLVQDAATGNPIPDVRIDVEVAPHGRPGEAISTRATTEAATNKLYQAAVFTLPEPGWWDVEVVVSGSEGTARVTCEVEAAAALPRWLSLWPWVCWPALAVVLFCIHLWLARRRVAPRINSHPLQ